MNHSISLLSPKVSLFTLVCVCEYEKLRDQYRSFWTMALTYTALIYLSGTLILCLGNYFETQIINKFQTYKTGNK